MFLRVAETQEEQKRHQALLSSSSIPCIVPSYKPTIKFFLKRNRRCFRVESWSLEGELFANIWQTDRIVRVSPQSGKVVGWIDLTGLLSPVYRRKSDAVLNGIAYDSVHKRLFVTGKLWPKIFEIQLVLKHK